MLDLSKISALQEKNDAPKSPYSEFKEPAQGFIPAKKEPPSEEATKTDFRVEQHKATEKSLLEVGKLINARLQQCGTAIWAYNKAVRDDRPPEEVAMLAAKALSLAVSDTMIYSSLEKKYRPKYGIRVQPEPPYEIIHLV